MLGDVELIAHERIASFCVPVFVAHRHVRPAGGNVGEQARLYALPQGFAQRRVHDAPILCLCALPSKRRSRRRPSKYNPVGDSTIGASATNDGNRPSVWQNGGLLWEKTASTGRYSRANSPFLKKETAPTCCFSVSSARCSVLERRLPAIPSAIVLNSQTSDSVLERRLPAIPSEGKAPQAIT